MLTPKDSVSRFEPGAKDPKDRFLQRWLVSFWLPCPTNPFPLIEIPQPTPSGLIVHLFMIWCPMWAVHGYVCIHGIYAYILIQGLTQQLLKNLVDGTSLVIYISLRKCQILSEITIVCYLT